MLNSLRMNFKKSKRQICNHSQSFLFSKQLTVLFTFVNQFLQRSSLSQLHDNALLALELDLVEHLDHKRMINHIVHAPLILLIKLILLAKRLKVLLGHLHRENPII